MAGNDFYDDDLIRQRDRAARIKMGPGDEPAPPRESADDAMGRPISDLNLTRMARHKQDVDSEATRRLQEIELLKKRQEQLEMEKRELEEFKHKTEEFERGKREVMAGIKRSLTTLERDEMDARRLTELLESTRARFKVLLADLDDLKEQAWSDETIREELARALGVIEDARMEYNKATAKVEAVKAEKSGSAAALSSPVMFEDAASGADHPHDFAHWLKIGVAVSLPLIVTLVILAVIYFFGSLNAAW
jgi:DNA repair exonuclease SbcCD ATPase subunit